jgi:hypothetical protein
MSNASVLLIDPVGSVSSSGGSLATRQTSLDGKVMGIVDDGLKGTDDLLAALADEIAKRFQLAGRREIIKPSMSSPLPDDLYKAMLSEVDFVLVGVGICGSCSSCCVHDAVTFELDGVPAIAVVEDTFEVLAEFKRDQLGLAEFEPLIVDHPIGERETARRKGAELADRAVAWLTTVV